MYKITQLRWSMIGAWEYDRHQWFTTYVLKQFQSSPELSFGSMVDKRIQEDMSFIPSLPRYPEMQHTMKVMFDGLLLTGTADGIDFEKKILIDYKTGKKPWTKGRAKKTGQLTMYLFMLWLADPTIKPEEWKLGIHWLPTDNRMDAWFKRDIFFRDDPVIPKTFETTRSMEDLVAFGEYIKKTVVEMEEYANSHLT